MTILLFAVALVGLFLTAIGLPGTWLLLAVATIAKLATPEMALAWWPIWTGFVLAFIAEGIEFLLATSYAKKYGGSNRAGWGALIGGLAGALVGFPVPLIGPLIGAVLGTFIGALVAEWSATGMQGDAGRVAWGAMLGRVLATVVKVGIGFVIAVLILFSALT